MDIQLGVGVTPCTHIVYRFFLALTCLYSHSLGIAVTRNRCEGRSTAEEKSKEQNELHFCGLRAEIGVGGYEVGDG